MECNNNEADATTDVSCKTTDHAKETNNHTKPCQESASSGGGDIDSVQSDGAKTSEPREERIRRLKEKAEAERQRKYAEILQSQKQSSELLLRQQEDRRRKIEELKRREEERTRKVEQRRQEAETRARDKNESMLARTREREARAAARVMTRSVTAATTTVAGTEGRRRREASSAGSSDRGNSRSGPRARRRRTASSPRCHGYMSGDHHPAASSRHAGCFLPWRGVRERVRGVLAWGPPPVLAGEGRGSRLAWWEALPRHGPRTSSAHASLTSTAGHRPQERSPRPPAPARTPSALFDRLSTPRGTSQPPRSSSRSSPMTTSLTTARTPSRTPLTPATPRRRDKPVSDPPPSAPSPASEHTSEMASLAAATSEEAPRPSSTNRAQTSNGPKAAAGDGEEAAYRQKLAEQRRLAREAKERQQEERRRQEEAERELVALEQLQAEEDQRLVQEAAAREAEETAEAARAEEERLRLQEDRERALREEAEREEEDRRQERLRSEDCDRMERKRRLEKIMSRVKKPEEGNGVPVVAVEDGSQGDSGAEAVRPRDSWAGPEREPGTLSAAVAGLQGPEAPSPSPLPSVSLVTDTESEAPQFRNPYLRSLMEARRGSLTMQTDSSKRQSLVLANGGPQALEGLPHSHSCQCDLSAGLRSGDDDGACDSGTEEGGHQSDEGDEGGRPGPGGMVPRLPQGDLVVPER